MFNLFSSTPWSFLDTVVLSLWMGGPGNHIAERWHFSRIGNKVPAFGCTKMCTCTLYTRVEQFGCNPCIRWCRTKMDQYK